VEKLTIEQIYCACDKRKIPRFTCNSAHKFDFVPFVL